MKKILVVCSGNICRSPMAAGILRKFLADAGLNMVQVDSAGTLGIEGAPASAFGQQVCLENFGVELASHRSQGVTNALLRNADLVLCMAKKHVQTLENQFPNAAHQYWLLKHYAGETGTDLDVADPIGQEYARYRATCLELGGLLARCIPKIRASLEP